MTNCIFCKIAKKEVPSKIVYENEKVIAFKDINPKARIHFLIVPKQHIDSIKSKGSEKIVKDLIVTAKKIAKTKKISGYKLVFNVGKKGGQLIDHLHLHFLAGKSIKLP